MSRLSSSFRRRAAAAVCLSLSLTALQPARGLTPLAPLSHRPPNPRERGESTPSSLLVLGVLGGGAPLPGAGGRWERGRG